ncbi:hypothetical protein PQX77_010660 [Marasmius sp. AFHP31]|nr:hypothetical protein PQX77_010660 [Marasmius sp. AFHP31]
MATLTVTTPKQLEENLRNLAIALYIIEDNHPLLELADDACSCMVALIEKDPRHTIDDRGYRDFYRIVRHIIKLAEKHQNTDTATKAARFRTLGLIKLKRKLKKEFKRASGVSDPGTRLVLNYWLTEIIAQATTYKWEDALILAGGVASTISTIPGLTLLKPVGAVLGQLGELIKTMHGNKDECAALLYLATHILADLSGKISVQVETQPDASPYEVAEDMRRGIEAFERRVKNH